MIAMCELHVKVKKKSYGHDADFWFESDNKLVSYGKQCLVVLSCLEKGITIRGQRKKGRWQNTLKRPFEDEILKVGLSREDVICQ